ncbi:DNA replication and repair protein RecO [Flavobacterium cauense R2A-7]|uniref:DNA repair protein RecO n=1 Tax=Flavobacterium cauense R2A-7 TaxID=1341154 RepID=A0A562LNW5_9FLAO|nr:DNA repair protein RecO [Flavobacterium cauense]KGO80326.1 DNA recombination protein RecO [Flavobacterium cauense R2A-7]TWI09329.1 DNA replication and repair protein RecO [Flavobacterium cauense R2A-7]
MLVKTKAIVLSALKYQEKSLIVKCFTQSDGLKSYFVPSAFSGKKSNQKIAYFQPLTILEIEANHKNKGTLEYFKEIRLASPYHSINTDVFKSTIVIFLSEMLHHSIREEEKNDTLFSFLETALLWLDTHEEMANFHLILLLEITKFLGFYPDLSEKELSFFELSEGIFTPYHGISCLSEHETFLFKKLIGLKFDSDQKIFAGTERQILLKILLDYYSAHLDGFKKPKSLEVLKEVFS